MRTRSVLDHEERSVYRIAVAATDNGIPPKQTVRVLRVEILDVNDNRPTFSSSSLIFKVSFFFQKNTYISLARVRGQRSREKEKKDFPDTFVQSYERKRFKVSIKAS